ncbi:leucine-rich repeat domain-containing protein [Chryseobacterium sp. JM1]|uniref:leucine-rich repeat domain-containing protein n=1 Tax=Chryseobacterium sp. JM1 TaxID=1233950 RepID=UPI0004E78100|nr:leucine-rich repeat domain-containing protein [Chryseobacterium sp. JM1]KFF22250.1 hypothetical protein IW22_03430 [Chryseobacterium sp. JM1]
MKTKEELRLYFENGDKPTQEHFWAWLDSYWHKDEKISSNSLNLISYEDFAYSNTDNTEIIGIGKKIKFPEGAKIIGGFTYAAASKNHISEVRFPGTLERLKSLAFAHQHLRGTLKIPGSCKVIEANAFLSSNDYLSELILENGIEEIGGNAFQLAGSKNLTQLHIPKSVKSVGQNAFNIPALKTVTALNGLDLSNAGIPETAKIMRYFDFTPAT